MSTDVFCYAPETDRYDVRLRQSAAGGGVLVIELTETLTTVATLERSQVLVRPVLVEALVTDAVLTYVSGPPPAVTGPTVVAYRDTAIRVSHRDYAAVVARREPVPLVTTSNPDTALVTVTRSGLAVVYREPVATLVTIAPDSSLITAERGLLLVVQYVAPPTVTVEGGADAVVVLR